MSAQPAVVVPLRPRVENGPVVEARMTEERKKLVGRLHALATVSWHGAAVAVPAAVLLGPFVGEWTFPVLALSWVVLIPCGGLALLAFAAVRRNAAELRALLFAALSLALSIWALPIAGNAAAKVFLASRADELTRLAEDIRDATPATEPANQVESDDRIWKLSRQFERRLDAAGVRLRLTNLKGGAIVFGGDSPFTPDLAYVHGSGPACGSARLQPRVRFLGGRWYAFRCVRVPVVGNEER